MANFRTLIQNYNNIPITATTTGIKDRFMNLAITGLLSTQKLSHQSPPSGWKLAFSLASPLAICCARHPCSQIDSLGDTSYRQKKSTS